MKQVWCAHTGRAGLCLLLSRQNRAIAASMHIRPNLPQQRAKVGVRGRAQRGTRKKIFVHLGRARDAAFLLLLLLLFFPILGGGAGERAAGATRPRRRTRKKPTPTPTGHARAFFCE
nr:hypothetical protein [Pandoravirus massiliensis]